MTSTAEVPVVIATPVAYAAPIRASIDSLQNYDSFLIKQQASLFEMVSNPLTAIPGGNETQIMIPIIPPWQKLFSHKLSFFQTIFVFHFLLFFTPGHLQRRVWVLRNDQRVQNIGWKIKRTRHRQSFDVRQRRIEHLESCLLCPEPCFKSQVSYARPKQQQKTLQKPRWRGLDNGTGRVLYQMVELLLSTDGMLSARHEIVGRKHGRRYR